MTEAINKLIESGLAAVAAHAGLLLVISVASFVLGALLLPLFVTRIPADYFSRPQRQRLLAGSRHPLLALLLAAVKNLTGLLLVLAGLVMLVTPGQGVLTLLVGLMIMNYPGKYRLERWLINRPRVLPAVNWLRAKFHHPPLEL